jgi:ATP-dependent RNA helicase DeaD
LLAERSPEDIAAALARLYRVRLPSPEDILDPGPGGGRSRDDRGREKDSRAPRGDNRGGGPRSKPGKSSPRHAMAEGSVWFRAAIGRKKNAEARWLLPMICRRGGIDKQDTGAIRIMDTTTEFEISKEAAESFAVKIRGPDKEDNIRIEPMAEAPQAQSPRGRPAHTPRREDRATDRSAHRSDNSRDDAAPKHHGKPRHESRPGFGKEAGFEKKQHRDKPAHTHQPQPASAPAAKPGLGNKAKKHRRG